MENGTLNQILVGDEKFFLLTKAEGNNAEDSIDLTLWDLKTSWRGSLTQDDIELLSRKAKMNVKEFINQTTLALTEPSGGNYLYSSSVKGNTRTLIWKKHLAEADVKFQLGSVILTKETDTDTILRRMLEHSVQKIGEMKKSIQSLEATNQRLSAERSSVLKRLDKCVSSKEEREFDLYSKFAAVVNEKKAKIRTLIKRLNEKQANSIPDTTDDQPIENSGSESETSKKSMKEAPRDVISTPSEDDTDDELPAAKRLHVTAAAVSHAGDSPLIQEMASFTGGRRRARASEVNRKHTPSKPVIPKVASTETPSTSGQRNRRSVRKSASSSQKSDTLDADDLMDHL